MIPPTIPPAILTTPARSMPLTRFLIMTSLRHLLRSVERVDLCPSASQEILAQARFPHVLWVSPIPLPSKSQTGPVSERGAQGTHKKDLLFRKIE